MRFLPSGNKKAIQEWLQYGCIHKWTYKVYSKWLGKNRFYCTVRIIGHKVMCKFTSPPLATRPAQQTCAATWKLSFGVRRVFERVGMQSCTVPKMIFFSAQKIVWSDFLKSQFKNCHLLNKTWDIHCQTWQFFFASQEQLERQGSESAAALQVGKRGSWIGENFGGKRGESHFYPFLMLVCLRVSCNFNLRNPNRSWKKHVESTVQFPFFSGHLEAFKICSMNSHFVGGWFRSRPIPIF